MRVPTDAAGKEFTHIPEHVRQDLETLERECAIYADLWIEEIGDFRHVRIDFTPEERDEFCRRSWAYELFLRADSPTWAAETPGIDADIAKDADTYSSALKDGGRIPPPYHCFAAFLGRDLEALCCTRTDREIVIDLITGREAALFEVKRAFDSLTATIHSFNKREKGLASWKINREKDVRDLLYVMLRPRIFDLVKEEVIPSKAGTSKVADLCSPAVKFLIELKWIGKEGDWKKRIDEIRVDIQSYGQHPACRTLFFVIVDTVRDIEDPRKTEAAMTEKQTIGGREIDICVRVCEP